MRRYLTISAGVLTLAACTASKNDATADTAVADSPATATVADPPVFTTMRDASGRELGVLTLMDTTGGIGVWGRLTGLPPGEHALHLHMSGRCDPPTFESAGAHWNPTSRQHGMDNPEGPHLGDMPNVSAGADSTAIVEAVTAGGSLRGTTDMLLDADGATLIIHLSRDDYRTDPSGGSGARLACGVVSGT